MTLWYIFEAMWRPVMEIFVLTVGIYYAFNLIRRTRGWPVIIGFGVLLVLLIATAILDLQVLNWLLRAFFAVSAFAILILFQPELRRLLAELGNLPIQSSLRERREDVEMVIQSVERLAEAHIGALLAMEVSLDVRDAVESGVVVDCEATPEMVETIFFPNNAIHDGGVIIKGGRITHAACIFPLTQRQDLNKSLGTRHRAAIGLSEETDAVVVVVSEETGAISYAYKGELQKGVTVEALRAFLTPVFVRPGRTRSWLDSLRHWAGDRSRTGPPAQAKTKSEQA
jgi:diadenylate cyclase